LPTFSKEGRTRRLAIGKLRTLTPEEARELARDKLVEATKGGDPSAERHAIKAANLKNSELGWFARI
jgi:hypothetical protein